jgi:hypothetical protein
MIQGGGFCEKHGPFDPPHLVCPYCVLEEEQRRAYGPPPPVPPDHASEQPPEAPLGLDSDQPSEGSPAAGFVRQTVEPDAPPDVTEVIARQVGGSDNDQVEDDPLPLLGWLIVKRPREHRGAILAVKANQSIGRGADVRWDDPRLSRQHARLTVEPPPDAPDDPPVFYLWPFGPTNPVAVNGQEVRGATPIHENDEILLGDTLFVFKVLED